MKTISQLFRGFCSAMMKYVLVIYLISVLIVAEDVTENPSVQAKQSEPVTEIKPSKYHEIRELDKKAEHDTMYGVESNPCVLAGGYHFIMPPYPPYKNKGKGKGSCFDIPKNEKECTEKKGQWGKFCVDASTCVTIPSSHPELQWCFTEMWKKTEGKPDLESWLKNKFEAYEKLIASLGDGAVETEKPEVADGAIELPKDVIKGPSEVSTAGLKEFRRRRRKMRRRM